jgi:hypothetical protein
MTTTTRATTKRTLRVLRTAPAPRTTILYTDEVVDVGVDGNFKSKMKIWKKR